ncbi:cytochrome c [Cytophagaceae bacterium ABcell3]|nr:cytochrome c [Cytophagaceae bacterium ABcell3]
MLNKLVFRVTGFFLMLVIFQAGCNGDREHPQEEEEVDALADPMSVKGVGPIDEVALEAEIDQAMAGEGQKLFEQYCTACHKVEQRYIGPAVKEVTARRSPEWIMNMILNPDGMVREDPIARQLLQEYLSPMPNQNLTQQEARSILEYFRTLSEVEELD